MIIANLALCTLMAIYHLILNAHSWNNKLMVKVVILQEFTFWSLLELKGLNHLLESLITHDKITKNNK